MSFEQKTVVVLGKSRSGTSVTAGLLAILGVDMGTQALPTTFNPKGTYEDEDFEELNLSILSAAGGDHLVHPPSHDAIMAQREVFDEQIKKLMARKSRPKIWGWKKPSTTPVIELYVPHLINPFFVVVFRNPIATAQSLVQFMRHKKQVTILDMLKVSNTLDHELFTFLERHQDLPWIFISFEDIIANPVEEAKRLADFLGLELDESKIDQINCFIIPRERIEVHRKMGFVKSLPRYARKFIGKLDNDPREARDYLNQGLRLLASTIWRQPKR